MSKLVGLMLCRNSDWILGFSARAALMWCDELVILLHCCNRATCFQVAEIMAADGARSIRRIVLRSSHNPAFSEMALRQDMLEISRGMGATHIVTIDDDEVLTGNLLPDIRRMVEETPMGSCLTLPWLQIVDMGLGPGHMTSGHWGRSPVSVAFPDQPALHWRIRESGYDHHHRHPMGAPFVAHSPIQNRDAGLMHFQFASRRRLLAKQFWYQLQERVRWPQRPVDQIRAMYTFSVGEAERAKVSPAPDDWFKPYDHLLQYLHLDREPWQEAECKRILVEHPGIEEGLNDFGLLKQWRMK